MNERWNSFSWVVMYLKPPHAIAWELYCWGCCPDQMFVPSTDNRMGAWLSIMEFIKTRTPCQAGDYSEDNGITYWSSKSLQEVFQRSGQWTRHEAGPWCLDTKIQINFRGTKYKRLTLRNLKVAHQQLGLGHGVYRRGESWNSAGRNWKLTIAEKDEVHVGHGLSWVKETSDHLHCRVSIVVTPRKIFPLTWMKGWMMSPSPVIAYKTPKNRIDITASMTLIKKPHLHKTGQSIRHLLDWNICTPR